MFSPPSSTNRNPTLGSQKLANGRIGNSLSWGFGVNLGGAPGLQSLPSRGNGGVSSFAQTIGATPSQSALDPSDFPSLSDGSQTQQSNPSPAIWSSSTALRGSQYAPTQRNQFPSTPLPSLSNLPQGQQPQQQQQQQQYLQAQADGQPSGSSHPVDDNSEYRFRAQPGVGQLTSGGQSQTGNIEEFPPLGRSDTDFEQDRGNVFQSSAFPGLINGSRFGAVREQQQDMQARNGVIGQTEQESSVPGSRLRSPTSNSAAHSNSLSPREPVRLPNDVDRSRNPSNNETSNNQNNQNIPYSFFSNPQNQAPSQRGSQPLQEQHFGTRSQDSDATQTTLIASQTNLDGMSELDRFGLAGLLNRLRAENGNPDSLVYGQDLTSLGLDLNRADNCPLYPTFLSPFEGSSSQPLIPDFTLPAAYSVQNVPALHQKVPSLSDETLFMIFYQNPRDILQEIAAAELVHRAWRWHKILRQWMMKDESYGAPAPVRVSEQAERGNYIVFDVNTWRRERKEILLHYADLCERHVSAVQQVGAGL